MKLFLITRLDGAGVAVVAAESVEAAQKMDPCDVSNQNLMRGAFGGSVVDSLPPETVLAAEIGEASDGGFSGVLLSRINT